jgi:hypothetical protein
MRFACWRQRRRSAVPWTGSRSPDVYDAAARGRRPREALSHRAGLLSRTVGAVRAVDGVSFTLRPARRSGWSASPAAARPRPGAACCASIEAQRGPRVFDGRDLFTLSRRALRALRRELQIIFQDPYSLNPRMSVGEILAEPLRVHGWRRAVRRDERVTELLDQVGLPPAAAALSARVLGRPAPAHRHRARAGAQPEAGRVRRAGLGARRVGAGAGVNLLLDLQRGARAHLPLHLARPLGGRTSPTAWR